MAQVIQAHIMGSFGTEQVQTHWLGVLQAAETSSSVSSTTSSSRVIPSACVNRASTSVRGRMPSRSILEIVALDTRASFANCSIDFPRLLRQYFNVTFRCFSSLMQLLRLSADQSESASRS